MATILFIIAAVFGILAIIGFSARKNVNNNLPIQQREWIDLSELSFNNEQLQNLFVRLKEIYYNGDTMCNELTEIQNELNNIEIDTYSRDLFDNIIYEIISREPIARKTDKILLKPKEQMYFYSDGCTIDKIKTLMKQIYYTGFRYNKGLFRSGNMWITADDVQGMRRWDAGDLFVTNQRIVFNGVNQHNFSIPLGQILSYATYENNGIILTIANQKPIIISFPFDNKFHNVVDETGDIMPILRDHKIHMLYALDKVFELRNSK